MGSDQIAEIAPGVREALAGGPSWCVSFKITGDPNRWVQLTGDTINAAYPYVEAPGARFDALGSFAVTEWEANKFVTGTLVLEDARSIARWIDRYFAEVLGCDWDYSVDWVIEDLG